MGSNKGAIGAILWENVAGSRPRDIVPVPVPVSVPDDSSPQDGQFGNGGGYGYGDGSYSDAQP